MRFRWACPLEFDAADAVATLASARAGKRWAITDFSSRTIKRPTSICEVYLELEWTYTATGGSINDGRRLISLVLCEWLGIDPERPERYLLDADGLWPDVLVVEAQPPTVDGIDQLADTEVAVCFPEEGDE